MTGGGGGTIIIRPMLEPGNGGRLTTEERKALEQLMAQCHEPFNERDASTLARIVKAFVKRP